MVECIVIHTYKDHKEILRTVCKPVDESNKHLLSNILDAMRKDLASTEKGIAIAANQSGFDLRVILFNTPKHQNKIIINPVIKSRMSIAMSKEGCLSFPGTTATVPRHKFVKVEFLNENMETETLQMSGLDAFCIQHECLPRYSRILTPDGYKNISNIKLGDKVRSLSPEGIQEFVSVVGVSKTNNIKKKKWIKLSFTKSKYGPVDNLVCTEDHPCAYVDNLLGDLEIKYTEAKNMVGKYALIMPNNRVRNKSVGMYNKDQLSVIIGSLLGDGNITVCSEFVFTCSEKNLDYARYRSMLINGRIEYGKSGFSKNKTLRVICNGGELAKYFRNLMYVGKKSVTKEVCDLIDDIALAFWYMDDGSIRRKFKKDTITYGECILHTEGFDIESVDLLIATLKQKFNIEAKRRSRKLKSGIKYIIVIPTSENYKLFNIISKHIIPTFHYKLPDKYRRDPVNLNRYNYGYSLSMVRSIHDKKFESRLFDIQVDKNSNFFANNILVHNCDHLNGKTFLD